MDDTLILDRYRPLAKAGAGAFGTVQVAWDTTIQRKVAIKCIHLSAADAYALTQDSARTAGAVARSGTGAALVRAAFEDEEDARVFGDAVLGQMASGLADDDPMEATYAWQEEPETGSRPSVKRVFGKIFGTGTVKLAPEERGAVRGKGVTPVGSGSGAQAAGAEGFGEGTGTALSQHFLADLPGLDEARTAALLSDANIVSIYDFQVVGLMAYLIMEYVEGMTLTRFLRDYDDRLSLDVIAAVFHDVAHALTVAHGSGVLHLDIKPDNVLIDKRGQVKVTDFGLATLADAQGYGLAGGGTIGYMPPEQMMQEQLDGRTDEWALASIAYEMLSGINPFVTANNLDDALALIDSAELVLPSLCWRGLDARVDDVIFAAMDPDREGRYDSVADFAAALQPCLGNVAEGHRVLAEIVGSAKTDDIAETLGAGAQPAGAAIAKRSPRAMAAVRGYGAAGAGSDIIDVEDLSEQYGAQGYLAPTAAGAGQMQPVYTAPSASDGASGKATKPAPKITAQRAGGHFFAIWGRVIGFAFSGALMLLACLNIPLFSTFHEPMIAEFLERLWPAALEVNAATNSLLWALVVVTAILAAIKPTWGALVALVFFGISLAWRANVWLGLAVVLAVGLWWYCTGRHGAAQANCGLAYPLFGSFGCAPFATLATGIGMGVLDAAVTSLLGVVLCLACACLGSGDILNWQLGTYWNFAEADVAAGFSLTVASLRNWILAAGFMLAAVVGGLCTIPRHRWMNVVGAVAASVILLVALFLGTWFGSGQVTWAPGTAELVKLLLCCAVGIAAAALFVPTPRKRKRAEE